jgi:hypothetical protein
MSRVIRLDLGVRANRIDPAPYIASTCFHLTIPQHTPIGLDVAVPRGFDYAVGICRGTHKGDVPQYLDHAGNHSCSCSTAHKARCVTHGMINGTITKFGGIAGYNTENEPSTFGILNGSFAPDKIRGLFPKAPKADSKALQKQLEADIDQIEKARSASEKRKLYKQAIDRVQPPVDQEDACTVRADSSVSAQDGTGLFYLVDASVTHTTSISALLAAYRYHMARLAIERDDFAKGVPTAHVVGSSPQVGSVVKKKNAKYGLVERLLNLQAALSPGGGRKAKFVAAVMSHRGELCGGLIDLIETFAGRFKAIQRVSENIDGLTPAQATACFRSDFKNALFVALAKGWGMQILSTGCYFRNRRTRKSVLSSSILSSSGVCSSSGSSNSMSSNSISSNSCSSGSMYGPASSIA